MIHHTQIRLFADDTCLYITVDNRTQAKNLIESDLRAIKAWSDQWFVTFSPPKTKSLIFSNKRDRSENPPLNMDNIVLNNVETHKHLGIVLSHNLSWTSHVDEICLKAETP